MKNIQTLPLCGVLFLLTSCSIGQLAVDKVAYQSVQTVHAQPTSVNPIPNEAKIAVVYTLDADGKLSAIVYNRTSEIMIIDQTSSFFVNSTGVSTSYYDPTVRTTSTTESASKTSGASVNLGSIAGALGVGGRIGSLLNGVNVGGAGTRGQEVTNATYITDQPRVSLAPKSNGAMSKVFQVTGLDKAVAFRDRSVEQLALSAENSHCKFSVCISYSLDGGETFKKLVTDFYVNSRIIVPVQYRGRVNDALRKIYTAKTDALHEPWWILHFSNNVLNPESTVPNQLKGFMPDNPGNSKFAVYDTHIQGILYDYQ